MFIRNTSLHCILFVFSIQSIYCSSCHKGEEGYTICLTVRYNVQVMCRFSPEFCWPSVGTPQNISQQNLFKGPLFYFTLSEIMRLLSTYCTVFIRKCIQCRVTKYEHNIYVYCHRCRSHKTKLSYPHFLYLCKLCIHVIVCSFSVGTNGTK